MRKNTAVFLALFLCACSFASCGSSDRTVTISPRPVEIVKNDLSVETEAVESNTEESSSIADAEVESRYILNTGTKKIHTPECSGVKQMKEENKEEYIGTVSELVAKGYEPCGTCKPQ